MEAIYRLSQAKFTDSEEQISNPDNWRPVRWIEWSEVFL